MVALLDLPSEILGLVLRHTVDSINPDLTICSSEVGRPELCKDLDKALDLRLVHSSFPPLVDSYLFKQYRFLINDSVRKHPRPTQGLVELVSTNPRVATHARRLEIVVDHWDSEPGVECFVIAEIDRILLLTSRYITILDITTDDVLPVIRFYPGTFHHRFSNLRELRLGDGAFTFSLPVIMQASPLLSYVMFGDTYECSFSNFASMSKEMALLDPSEQPPLPKLKVLEIWDFGAEWMQFILQHFKPSAGEVTLMLDLEEWSKCFEQQFTALSYLADYPGFHTFNMVNYCESALQSPHGFHDFMEEVLPSHIALFKALQKAWKGKGVRMRSQQPKTDWRDLHDGVWLLSELLDELVVIT